MSSVYIKYIKCSNCNHEFEAYEAEEAYEIYMHIYNKKKNKIEEVCDNSQFDKENYIPFNEKRIKEIPCPKCNKKKLEIISKRIFY